MCKVLDSVQIQSSSIALRVHIPLQILLAVLLNSSSAVALDFGSLRLSGENKLVAYLEDEDEL